MSVRAPPSRRLHALTLCAALLASASAAAAPMQWAELLGRPRPRTTPVRIPYGKEALQFVELWLPEGKGPFPVVLLVHGGCWQTDVAQADIMGWIAEDLRASGLAVWNVEYRGVDRPGGGYPGTFRDVAAATDLLRSAARDYPLNVDKVVALGHSAGGHLVLWLAGRGHIPGGSPLKSSTPLPIATVIASGAIPDLEDAQKPPGTVCEIDPIHQLTGAPSKARPDVYADTSPVRLLPLATKQVLVNATLDGVAPPAFATAWAAQARKAGSPATLLTIPGEGHVELIAPGTASWAAEKAAILQALGRTP
jgi:acetyl esterase/lipase